jgi:drug/metabolite transporter (DMT)-like permease
MARIYTLLLTGVVIASTSSLLIRWAGAVPFAVIAFYRLFISMAVLISFRQYRHSLSSISFRSFQWQYLLAGFFLAAHLIAWIASLQMTTIANSIFLEGTHPLFAALFSAIFLKEIPRKATLPLFFLAGIGMFIIVSSDLGFQGGKVAGDLLAISSAAFLALYLMIARMHRSEPDFAKYLMQVYGAASGVSLMYVVAVGDALRGYFPLSWIMIVLLALGPNLTGHSLLNWASRHIEIYRVNLALLLEPVLATIGGMAFFQEFPGVHFYWGAGLIILSVALLVFVENRPAPP